MTEPTAQQAIDTLDAAISTYMAQISAGRAVPTGWLLTVQGVDVETGREMLAHEAPPAQTWTTKVGMAIAAADYHRAGGRAPRDRP